MNHLENQELRHVQPMLLGQVAALLEIDDLWKKLMSNIPLNPDDENNDNPKYSITDIFLIEKAGKRGEKGCAEILFKEWGTSGRIRPTVGYLLKMLIKSELYRAADYVSIHLLKGSEVKRPSSGPAAPIDISLTKLQLKKTNNDTENFLNKMDYPEFNQNNNRTIENNLNYEIEKNRHMSKSLSDNQESNRTYSTTLQSTSVSDMMKFSRINSTDSYKYTDDDRPAISALLNTNGESEINVEAVNTQARIDYSNSSVLSESEHNIPNFNLINESDHQIEISQEYSCDVPMLSAFQNVTSANNNQIMNTSLPHYEYSELEKATHQFDNRMYNRKSSNSGCKLGSGGTGTVYIARGIFQYPVAVKKLSAVNNIPQSTLAKQFKIEIEQLSKYRHENLLILLGYSSNGPANCLIYEYIEGGTLQQAIASHELDSMTRMKIALGTAEGIHYLHYGYTSSLIHRDIKSANILLTLDRKPKLCDFGLVKICNEQTLTSHLIGTSAYIPPEAIRGDVSIKMDVYSYGVVLLELLTGLPPDDENRDGKDIITYIEETCEGRDFKELIDSSAGQWDCSESLYNLSKQCRTHKAKRILITNVIESLKTMFVY